MTLIMTRVEIKVGDGAADDRQELNFGREAQNIIYTVAVRRRRVARVTSPRTYAAFPRRKTNSCAFT